MSDPSLAEVLGVPDPANPFGPTAPVGQAAAPVGPTTSTPTTPAAPKKKLTAKQFCRVVLESTEFRSYIVDGILLRNLPAPILLRIMDTGWGKPVEKVEFKDTAAPLTTLSADALEQRAEMLVTLARQLRQQAPPADQQDGSIH